MSEEKIIPEEVLPEGVATNEVIADESETGEAAVTDADYVGGHPPKPKPQ